MGATNPHPAVASTTTPTGAGKIVGPHPSTILVTMRFFAQADITEALLPPTLLTHEARSLAEARDDALRLQGVTWLDQVRRALSLPAKTFSTASMFWHRFRLAHPGMEYAWQDATAACLLYACKTEDTLKKSRDILAAAYNLKAQPAGLELLSADDPVLDGPYRSVIGLERLVLECIRFDTRGRDSHLAVAKTAKTVFKPLPEADARAVADTAWTLCTELHKTFALLKQTSFTLAIACLELAAHLHASTSPDFTSPALTCMQTLDYTRFKIDRPQIMETLHDALDLYTHHTASTTLGPRYSLDDFLRIRLVLNKECTVNNYPRYTGRPVVEDPFSSTPTAASAINPANTTLQPSNGHPTPVSPSSNTNNAQAATPSLSQTAPDVGTLRFMRDGRLAAEEQAIVRKYFVEEWEEYDEEIEVPVVAVQPVQRERSARPSAPPPPASGQRPTPRDRDRDRAARPRDVTGREQGRRYDEREREREHERGGGGGGGGRYDGPADRRYDDHRRGNGNGNGGGGRGGGGRYADYGDERRRRDERR